MTYLVSLLICLFILGMVFSLALYAIRQFDANNPFRPWAIAAICLVAIIVLLGFVTGQFPMPGLGIGHH